MYIPSSEFKNGYNEIVRMDNTDMLMDFGVLKLSKGQSFSENENMNLERAYMLMYGEVTLKWNNEEKTIKRDSFLDEPPFVLHVPSGVEVTIIGVSNDSEITVSRTDNSNKFEPKLYMQNECRDEHRGEGTMGDTSTRVVRTVIDYSNAPYSNLVVGEVINFPGKWSSYPPHHHPQPEVYFYKTNLPQGYGHGECGDNVYKVYNNGTLLIREREVHSHCAAPGYALWYAWIIRHLENDPYITPIFVEEHKWVQDKDAKIWGQK